MFFQFFLLVRSSKLTRSFFKTNTAQVSRLLFLPGLADCSGSAWSVAFLALCSSGVQCKLFFKKSYTGIVGDFSPCDIGQLSRPNSPTNTRVISADVMRL